MAGKGPRPKDLERLASSSRAKDRASGTTTYVAEAVSQPALPVLYVPGKAGKKVRYVWPAATRRWWANWAAEPIAKQFRPTDWDFLLDTALIHARVWGAGDLSMLNELRLRVAKMGATAEDRARLRVTYAAPDAGDEPPAAVGAGNAGESDDPYDGFPRLVR